MRATSSLNPIRLESRRTTGVRQPMKTSKFCFVPSAAFAGAGAGAGAVATASSSSHCDAFDDQRTMQVSDQAEENSLYRPKRIGTTDDCRMGYGRPF
ncbi:MAG: hypothetical protein M1825_004146 [Sarcosagium campestre]|nr:MAG: hypothetical protein M1825_004146 [Sarcosagium campestre]